MVSRYGELFSDTDLDVLGRVSGHGPSEASAIWFRADPTRIEGALDEPATYAGLFENDLVDPFATVTPPLVFAVVVHRGATEIGEHVHVPERVGGRLVVPVFDGERLARYVGSPGSRQFLVELLGSYTKVLSGAQWERTRGRWRRRRFSELNPSHLAQMAAGLPFEERAGAYRRLGDLALFLNGVFPDHSARQTLAPIDLERIVRSIPEPRPAGLTDIAPPGRVDAAGPLLATLGPHWYRLASRLVPIPSMSEQLADAADHFEQARRFLTFVTDRYLWKRRDWLFPTV